MLVWLSSLPSSSPPQRRLVRGGVTRPHHAVFRTLYTSRPHTLQRGVYDKDMLGR